jgi:hypothetical protein
MNLLVLDDRDKDELYKLKHFILKKNLKFTFL